MKEILISKERLRVLPDAAPLQTQNQESYQTSERS